MNTSDIQTQAQGKSQILKDKEATELRSQELQTEFQQANAEEYQKGVDSNKTRLSKLNDSNKTIIRA
ncbi:hypothetical protein B9T66_08640 [Helicobacter sp. TUL]|uniref:hypothetical protein n=1 Tax=Helicobacter sp. TUL TaxID=1848928 RepID=UPI000BABD8C6|nr:hypothetical protein [Helicobacter sp. TUL]PAU99136.1 hypothetical protein B9T66_08640 [Helicobacter sp. TUL]